MCRQLGIYATVQAVCRMVDGGTGRVSISFGISFKVGISASLLLQQFILRRRGKFIPIFVRIPLHTNIFGCSNKKSDECHTLQCITTSRMMNGIELKNERQESWERCSVHLHSEIGTTP